jgi:hypothetical protein
MTHQPPHRFAELPQQVGGARGSSAPSALLGELSEGLRGLSPRATHSNIGHQNA